MILTSSIIGIIGIILFFIILFSYSKLLQKNEGGFLHLLMAFMYICWVPIPIVVYFRLIENDFLLIGTIFGFISLLLLIVTMILQASHISYSTLHHKEDEKFWDTTDSWMMQGLLGGQVELLACFLKGIWVIFLTACFWLEGYYIMFCLGTVFSIITIFYLFMLIDKSLMYRIKILGAIKLNYIIINLDIFLWFSLLIIWLILSN